MSSGPPAAEAGDTGTRNGRLPHWAGAAIAAGAASVVGANTLLNGYISDDFLNVVQDPWVLDLSRTGEAFSHDYVAFNGKFTSGLYRPMVFVAQALWIRLWGLHPWALHLLNVLCAAACAAAVYLVLAGWASPYPISADRASQGTDERGTHSRWITGPLLGAVLFAVHPIHSENVAWISDITDLGCALFLLLSLVTATRSSGSSRTTALLASVSFLLALMFKEPAVALLPAVLLAFAIRGDLRDGVRRPGALVTLGGLVAALSAYFALRVSALGGMASGARHLAIGRTEQVLTGLALFGAYLNKVVLPLHLSPKYDFGFVGSAADPRVWIGLAWVVGLACLVRWARRIPGVVLGVGLLVLPLLPALYLPGVEPGLFSERYLYLPTVGAALLCAVGWEAWRPRTAFSSNVRTVAAACVAVVASGATVERHAVWRDGVTLWTDTASKVPNVAIVYEYLGAAQLTTGRAAEAVATLSRAVELDPTKLDVRVNLASALASTGRFEEAIRNAQMVLTAHPADAEAYGVLGYALAAQGRLREAVFAYRWALEIEHRLPAVHNGLAIALAQLGDTAAAEAHFREAIRLEPGNSRWAENLAVLLRGPPPR